MPFLGEKQGFSIKTKKGTKKKNKKQQKTNKKNKNKKKQKKTNKEGWGPSEVALWATSHDP